MSEQFDEPMASISDNETIVESVSPEPVQPRPVPNFGMRILAFAIDAAIVGAVLLVLSYFLFIVSFVASAPKGFWNGSMQTRNSTQRPPFSVDGRGVRPVRTPVGGSPFSGPISKADDEKLSIAMGVTVLVIAGIDLILILLYDVLMTAFAGGSVGKLATGARVVDLDGNRVGFGKSLGRATVKLLTALLSCHLLFLVGAFTTRYRTLHDFASGTEVVSIR